jgi:hypothetical protein
VDIPWFAARSAACLVGHLAELIDESLEVAMLGEGDILVSEQPGVDHGGVSPCRLSDSNFEAVRMAPTVSAAGSIRPIPRTTMRT